LSSLGLLFWRKLSSRYCPPNGKYSPPGKKFPWEYKWLGRPPGSPLLIIAAFAAKAGFLFSESLGQEPKHQYRHRKKDAAHQRAHGF
jgi:hypothetical protein